MNASWYCNFWENHILTNSKADLLYSALCGIFPNHTELNLWGKWEHELSGRTEAKNWEEILHIAEHE